MKKRRNWKTGLRLWGRLILNWRFAVCFGVAWLITNGWSYVLLVLGVLLENAWMSGVAGAYLAFLWLPISPEKLVTVAICLFLVRILFPKHNRRIREELELAAEEEKEKKPKKKAKKDRGSA